MLKRTTASFPSLLRATALATSHRQPTNALSSALWSLPVATATSPLRLVHTTSDSVFTLSTSNLRDLLLQQQQQRDLATRVNHPVRIHEHTPALSTSEATTTIYDEDDCLSLFSSPDQDPTLPTVQITRDSTSLIITPPLTSQYHRPNQPSLTFDNTWLRDNCPCPKCVNSSTQQKLHLTEQVPRDMSMSSIQVYQHGLEVTWSRGLQDLNGESVKAQPGGHQSFYPWEMILLW